MVCSSVNGLRALRMCVLGPTLGLEELLTSAQWTAVCGDSASVRLPALGPLGRAVLGAAGGHRCGQPTQSDDFGEAPHSAQSGVFPEASADAGQPSS